MYQKIMRSTILIPAAGYGERLSLPIPKELLPIGFGKVVIDSTFDLLRPLSKDVNIIMVIGSHKLETVKYLEKYQNDFDIAYVFQKPYLPGFIGALRSAENFLGDKVILLLPDQILSFSQDSRNPILESFECLKKSSVCFIASLESDLNKFKDDGALSIEERNGTYLVTNYIDKPKDPSITLNAIWVGIGFNKSVTKEVFETIEESINKKLSQNQFYQSPFYKAPAILIDKYLDLGTWPRYRKWITDYS